MIDHTILSVRSVENNFEIDMELPSKISVADLAPQLLENLKAISPHHFMGKEYIKIKYKNIILKETDTLEKSGIWDGSIIEIV